MARSAVPHRVGWFRAWGAAMLVLAGCTNAAPATVPPAESAAPTLAKSLIAPGASASALPSSEPTPTTYTSNLYGYTVTLPVGWVVVPATIRWDGNSDPGHEEPTVDRMSGPTGHSLADAWAFSLPVTNGLAASAAARLAADAAVHPCPLTAATTTPITIDGTPGLLLARNCEILVLTAITIRNGTAFFFYLQDSSVQAATDAADESVFAGLLASLRLPK